ncbi:MAG: T9SS type A sorting domain-containing protein, partial [Candidatus Krumholzibacteriia bacterium]
ARVWARPPTGPVLRAERALGHGAPLAPAAGALDAGTPESLVVAFGDGHVRVLDEDLADRAGWPRELGLALDGAPLLVDTDGDGDREIVLVARDPGTGLALLRVLDAAGDAAVGDGTALATPDGGPWLALGPAVVTGSYGAGDLAVTVMGLAGNGQAGAAARWTLARGVLRTDGTAWAETLPGLQVQATTAEGQLVLDSRLLPAPVAWNLLEGAGTEPVQLASLHWTEVLYGLTSIAGGATAWYQPAASGRPLAAWQPLARSGPDDVTPGAAGALLVPRDDGTHLRVGVLDDQVTVMPVPAGAGAAPPWASARGDGRNSGAYPLDVAVSAVPLTSAAPRLGVYPNPGRGGFRFRLAGGPADGGPVRAEIYDLRGRRVGSLAAVRLEELRWDGRGADGRPLGAGTYLAVVRSAGRSHTTRVVLAR